MKSSRVLIVDDERLGRQRLSKLLEAHPEIAVVGEADSVETARLQMEALQPDLVFLDIQMPPGNGFDLIPHVCAATRVVFVTAYDSFALRAFEVNALDYLLKPVHPDRLASCLSRLRSPGEPPSPPGLTYQDTFIVKESRNWRKIAVADILLIQAEGTYSRVEMVNATREAMILRSLTDWMKQLPEAHFVRVSRSLIINLERLVRVRTIHRDASELILHGRSLPLTLRRHAVSRLRQRLRDARAPG